MYKKTAFVILSVLLFTIFLLPAAASYDGFVEENSRLNDSADLLTESEEATLLSWLDEISHEKGFDIVIYTSPDLNGYYDVSDFADDYYDNGKYGYGADRDGILFVISMEERDWYISTCGYGIELFSDYCIQSIGNAVVPFLSNGNYPNAFDTFITLCDERLTEAANGLLDNGDTAGADGYYADDYYNEYYGGNSYYNGYYNGGVKQERNLLSVKYILIAFFIGAVAALITVLIMRGKLKTVRFQTTASSYIKKDSMVLTDNRDVYLYRRVSKTPIPKQTSNSGHNSHSGGGSVHTSSSGTSHGGGGGKF